MKKFNLFLIGLSMILMSCENVQEKSEQFKQEFATAITNEKFEDAERIANDAQTYYEGLSDSNKKKYETCFPKFKVILAAKKFNKQWRDACSVVDPTKTLEFPSLDKIEKEAKQYMAGLDQQDAETFKAELTDFEADIIEYHAMYYTTNIFNALQEGDEDKAQKLSDLSDEYLETLNARLQDVYKKTAKAQTENLIKIMNQY